MSAQEPFTTQDDILEEVLRKINEIARISDRGDYIYRGEPEYFPKISSTLYREYAEQIDTHHFDIEIAQKEMLEQVKAYTTFADDTDILTELQHYGGNTNLIDFTTDYLIALFFACDSSYDEDGRIILLDRASKQELIKSPKKNQNNRVISQKSIFVQSPSGYIEVSKVEIVQIPKDLKQAAIEYLKKHHGITTETIYNDILGYIQNQHKHQNAYAEFYIGFTCSQKGEHEKAIPHYDKTIRLNPNMAVAYTNRGVAKDRLGWHEEAIADQNEAIRINPRYALAYTNRGAVKAGLSRYEEAIADWDMAIRFDPRDAKAHFNRGVAKAELGRREEAIADYDAAIRINPRDDVSYYNRGVAKDRLGRREEAIADYDAALAINPEDAESYHNRGVAKAKLGRYEEAIADYDAAISSKSDYASAYFGRGVAKAELGRLGEALVDYDAAIRLKVDYVKAYLNRGIVKTDLGWSKQVMADYDAANGWYKEAIADYDTAISIKSDYAATAYNYRGVAKVRLRQYEEAIGDYDEAISIKPDYAEVYTNRGLAKKSLREYAAANEDLNRAQILAQEQSLTDLLQRIKQELDNLKDSTNPPPFQIAPHSSGYVPGVDPEKLKEMPGDLDDERCTGKGAT